MTETTFKISFKELISVSLPGCHWEVLAQFKVTGKVSKYYNLVVVLNIIG